MKTQAAGQAAERLAEQFLVKRGLRLIERNFRTRTGEIDLVMRDAKEDALVFVEVRLRNNSHFGTGADSVTLSKQERLVRTAQLFLQARASSDYTAYRFDVISISRDSGIDWIPAAFTLD